ncbi:MAG: ATP-binding protein, partial [Candidatus Binataceae bacterium]
MDELAKDDFKPGELESAPTPKELSASELRGRLPVSPDLLARAAERGDAAEMLGQQRALDAIRLAIGIDAPGYNVFVDGLRTRQERETIVKLLADRAAGMPTPDDWIYVNNFRNPESPVAIHLRPGQGRELRDRMTELVNFVREQLPKAFRREDFDQERAALREKYNKRAQELFGNLEARARERGFAIQATPSGQVLFVPLIDGKMPESPEALAREMAKLPESERERLAKAQGELQGELGGLLMRQQELMHELADDVRAIERSFAGRQISPAIAALKQRFDNPDAARYLDEVAEHMLSHLDRFHEPHEGREGGPMPFATEDGTRFAEYQVNVLVDNLGVSGAPVISEDAPSYRNLFGTIERWMDPSGRHFSSFTGIIAGSFLKAHGGFLVFDLEDAIVEPGVWKTLKRSLKSGRMTLETFEPFPFFSISGLKPQPIEVRAKVIVLGGALLYNLLYFYDSDFAELFKVKAEIRPVVAADEAAACHYAARIAELCRREHLPAFE